MPKMIGRWEHMLDILCHISIQLDCFLLFRVPKDSLGLLMSYRLRFSLQLID
jgi:hypothetical protein